MAAVLSDARPTPLGEGSTEETSSGVALACTPLPGGLLFGVEHRVPVAVLEEVFSALMTGSPPPYNPLVLQGVSGVGKTHLARAMCDALRPMLGKNGSQYVRAAEFAQEFLEAIDADDISAWRDRYRGAQFLVLDDLEHLANKDLAQDELARTLDFLLAEGRQIIVLSLGTNSRQRGLNSNLAARLAGGLTVRLPLPELETRVAILAQAAEAKGARVTDEAILTLAKSLTESPLALQGAIMHLCAISGASEIDQAAVEAYLGQRGGPRTLTLRDIAVAAARHFSLPLTALRGNSRRKSVVAARGAAMWLSRRITDASLEQIGVFFGGRDHTTVLHACRRTEGLAATDRETRRAVDEIQALLGITP